MNLTEISGNILTSDARALVNPVNCVGAMGKGLALQFKNKFPKNFEAYKIACKAGLVKPGHMFTMLEDTGRFPGVYIVNFPTKRHWRDASRIEDIESGLKDLVTHKFKSIAIPKLGCGLGGLDWEEVRELIIAAFADSDTEVQLYV